MGTTKQVVDLLQSHEYNNESEIIEVAKGRYHLPTSFKGLKTQFKRLKKWRKKL